MFLFFKNKFSENYSKIKNTLGDLHAYVSEWIPGFIFIFFVALPAMCAIVLFGLAVYAWMRAGAWETMSVFELLVALGHDSFTFWQNWLGLKKLLSAIPLWLASAALSFIGYGVFSIYLAYAVFSKDK